MVVVGVNLHDGRRKRNFYFVGSNAAATLLFSLGHIRVAFLRVLNFWVSLLQLSSGQQNVTAMAGVRNFVASVEGFLIE